MLFFAMLKFLPVYEIQVYGQWSFKNTTKCFGCCKLGCILYQFVPMKGRSVRRVIESITLTNYAVW